MLPNESLLDTLHFVDYTTLVLSKIAASPFLLVATKFADGLTHRRRFQVHFFTTWITYIEVTLGARPTSVRYLTGNKSSLTAAWCELDAVIGPHAVAKLIFSENTWNMRRVRIIFVAAPPLKYAEDIGLYSRPFGEVQFSWMFLRRESARELRQIKFHKPLPWIGNTNGSIEELVRDCVTLPHLLGPLELDFTEYDFSGTFDLRIINLLKGSGRKLTFRMRTLREGGELMLDGSDYTVEVDNTTTRYTSEKSGIVVEVKGSLLAIQSTAAVPREKPRTSGEVLPTIPFVE